MKHMLMLYADTDAGAKIPPDQMAHWMGKMHAFQAALDKAGVYVAHAGLAPYWDATTINLSPAGEMQVHDGPYAETREQLGGFYIIDVEDMAAAQHWAAQCPGAIWGHIEIRPYSSYPGA
jgi:hypothetical protein